MILQSLAELARREGLVDSPDYETKEVHWEVVLKSDGRFISLVSLLAVPVATGRAKPRSRGPNAPVPRPVPGAARGGTAPDAGFLVDNAAFVLGLDLTKEQKIAARAGETERRKAAYRELIKDAARTTHDSGLAAVSAFLASEAQVGFARAAVLERAKAKEFASHHLIRFRVKDVERPVHLQAAVVAYWSSLRGGEKAAASAQQCLVSGSTTPTADKHPLIRKVPGGSSSGVAIVTFNKKAFESYGFDRNDNAPVSWAAAEAYTTALNRLLDPSCPDPRDPNTRLPEQRVQLSEDAVAVFWTDEESHIPAAIVPAVADGEPDAMAALAMESTVLAGWRAAAAATAKGTESAAPLRAAQHAPWTGIRPGEIRDPRPFRMLVLSGGQGRATVRAFHTTRVSAIVAAVRQWFADISLSTLRGKPALYRFLSVLAVGGDRKKLPPNLAGEVFLSVLGGGPLPEFVLEAALRRCRSDPDSREFGGRRVRNLKVSAERAAIIKAWLNRARRHPTTQSRLMHQHIAYQEVSTTMNENEHNRGYLLGRMFACIERMQMLALGDVGASITDRYFSSACATPQAVFPRLLKTEVHYFRKAREGRFGGSARWVHGAIDQLGNWLVGEANGMQSGETVGDFLRRSAGRPLVGFPAFLPLPEQGLFALGYHQQRAEFFTKRETADEPTAEDDNLSVNAAE